MSRKDIEAVADMFSRVAKRADDLGLDVYRRGYLYGADTVLNEFLKIAKASNYRFNEEGFMLRVNRGA